MKNKSLLIRGLISLALLIWLFYAVPFKTLLPIFWRAHIGFALLVIVSVVVDRILMAFKWRLLVQAMGISVPFFECVRVYLVGNFAGQFFPTSVGGDVIRMFLLDVDRSHREEIAASIVVERVVALIGLVLMILVASLVLMGHSFAQFKTYFFLAVVLLLLTTSAFIVSLYWLPTKWMDRSSKTIILKLKKMTYSYQMFRNRKKVLLIFLLISFFEHLFPVLGNYLTARTLNIQVNPWAFFVVVPIILLFVRLPISLDGLGVQEHLYRLLFPYAGYTPVDATAISLMLRLLTVIGSLPGAVLFVFSKKRLPTSLSGENRTEPPQGAEDRS